MARRGENIFKRKDGRWEARYVKGRNSEGRAIYGYVYASKYSEVKQKRMRVEIDLQSSNITNQDFRFNELIDKWLKSIKPLVKVSTYQSYERHIRNHIFPYFGKTNIKEIDQIKLQEFINHKLELGRLDHKGGLSPKTVKELISVIKLMLKYADDIGIHNYNNARLKIPTSHRTTDRLSNDEENLLLQNLELNPIGMAVILSIFCGMRIGEICALENNDIDLDMAHIKVYKTLYRIKNEKDVGPKTKIVIAETKTQKSTRVIPIPKSIIEIVKSYKSDSQYFISSNESPYEPRKINYQLKALLKRSGVRDIKFHTLRHTFASKCIESGFDYNTLSEILGHSKASTTMNIYVHTNSRSKHNFMNRLEFNSSQFLSQK